MARVVSIVLAAGASSRMGRPKALLPFGGRSALALVVGAARAGTGERALVVAARGPVAEAALALSDAGAVLENPAPERGPISSLQIGVAALPRGTDAFLVWPVDHPLAPAATVRALCQSFAGTPDPRAIVVPSHARRRGHPVLFGRALGDELLALGPDETARDVVARHVARIAYVDAPEDVLFDLDTSEDYARALVRFEARARG